MVFNCPFHLARVILKRAKQLPTLIPATPFPPSPLSPPTFSTKTPKIVPEFPPTPFREAGYTLVCESLI